MRLQDSRLPPTQILARGLEEIRRAQLYLQKASPLLWRARVDFLLAAHLACCLVYLAASMLWTTLSPSRQATLAARTADAGHVAAYPLETPLLLVMIVIAGIILWWFYTVSNSSRVRDTVIFRHQPRFILMMIGASTLYIWPFLFSIPSGHQWLLISIILFLNIVVFIASVMVKVTIYTNLTTGILCFFTNSASFLISLSVMLLLYNSGKKPEPPAFTIASAFGPFLIAIVPFGCLLASLRHGAQIRSLVLVSIALIWTGVNPIVYAVILSSMATAPPHAGLSEDAVTLITQIAVGLGVLVSLAVVEGYFALLNRVTLLPKR